MPKLGLRPGSTLASIFTFEEVNPMPAPVYCEEHPDRCPTGPIVVPESQGVHFAAMAQRWSRVGPRRPPPPIGQIGSSQNETSASHHTPLERGGQGGLD